MAHVNFALRNLKVVTNLKTGSTGRLSRPRTNDFRLFYIRICTISRISSRPRLDPILPSRGDLASTRLPTRLFTRVNTRIDFPHFVKRITSLKFNPATRDIYSLVNGWYPAGEVAQIAVYRRVLHPSNNQQCILR